MYRLQLIDVSKYPFLADLSSLLRSRYGIESLTLLLTRRREYAEYGLRRLEEAIRYGDIRSSSELVDREVLGYYASLALARLVGDRWLVSRLALAESERAARLLQIDESSVLESVARRVGLRTFRYHEQPLRDPVARIGAMVVYSTYEFSLSFVEYVYVARRLLGDPLWKPVNQPVTGGRVYLDKQRAVRVVKEAIMDYVTRQAASISVDSSDELSELVDRVRELLSKQRRRVARSQRGSPGAEEGPGVVVREAFPPCMQELVSRLEAGEHLSHHERFAIATFMLRIGASVDEVVDLFRNIPDFNERVTRYQVEHLAGLRGSMKKYFTYSCEKMKTLGICKADCGTRNPLQAYYANLRGRARRERKP